MPQIHRILHPTDFSERSETAWAYAKTLAAKFGAEIHLLHAMQDPVAVLPEASVAVTAPAANLPELIQAAEDGLKRFEAIDPGRIVNRVVLHGPTADEVVRYAKDSEADLIVIGTHGRTGLAHVLLGSVAEKIVRKSPCAVLTVRPHGHGADDAIA
ncbi:MAG: universal stress protein [Planctomycetota bacterium]|nr:universal stress protein [Planctomycetaceae bacterium]MDQ3330714.1 universal stress protein [Planctomycetota bacterium]